MDEEIDLKSLPVDQVVERAGVDRAIGIKHVASLLFSYRCTIACDHCLFSCSPLQPDVRVSFEDGVDFLKQLRQTDRVVHIAGGEPMIYYEEMLDICRAARAEGAAPHFFETNASWCDDDETTVTRYAALQQAGLSGVLISADPFHQASVSPEKRHRAYRWAVAIFGKENVAAGDLSLRDLRALRRIGRDRDALADYARQHPPRLVGRAGETLAGFFPDRPMDELSRDTLWHGVSPGRGCRTEFDADEMWEIHIDPYANIQTCCGIIVGNAREAPLVDWMTRGFCEGNPILRRVWEQGPWGLLRLAIERGYAPRSGYPQKCNLCWEVRKFLRPRFPETFGPAEIYARS